MKAYYKIKITFKTSANTSMDNTYLFKKRKGCKTTPSELAEKMADLTKKTFSFLNGTEHSVKIKEKSYKKVPKKYIVI